MDDFSKYSRIVIKIGSSILIDPSSYIFRSDWFLSFAQDVQSLVKQGKEVIIVASGSIASGCSRLGQRKDEFTLEDYQALAAYGQLFLTNKFKECFDKCDIKIAQLLLTSDDYQSRRRFLNTKFTINRLIEFGIVPIINENDTVATKEIRFGDNDNLAAKIAVLSDSDLLVILTDVNGLYDKNPHFHNDAKLIREITNIDKSISSLVTSKQMSLGTGGMGSKLKAMKVVGKSGVESLVTSGLNNFPISSLKDGLYSYHKPSRDKLKAKRKWLLQLKSRGSLNIDFGASNALKQGNSLLAVGINGVEGVFSKGDVLDIKCDGEFVAKGVVNFPKSELIKILGVQNKEHKKILGYPTMSSVIHVDNLVFF